MDTTVNAQQRMENKIDSIIDTLRTLARIEERTVATNAQLSQIADDVRDQDKRLRTLEVAMPENLDKRISIIETKMPGLVEMRLWIIGGVGGGLAMMAAGIIKLFFGA